MSPATAIEPDTWRQSWRVAEPVAMSWLGSAFIPVTVLGIMATPNPTPEMNIQIMSVCSDEVGVRCAKYQVAAVVGINPRVTGRRAPMRSARRPPMGMVSDAPRAVGARMRPVRNGVSPRTPSSSSGMNTMRPNCDSVIRHTTVIVSE